MLPAHLLLFSALGTHHTPRVLLLCANRVKDAQVETSPHEVTFDHATTFAHLTIPRPLRPTSPTRRSGQTAKRGRTAYRLDKTTSVSNNLPGTCCICIRNVLGAYVRISFTLQRQHLVSIRLTKSWTSSSAGYTAIGGGGVGFLASAQRPSGSRHSADKRGHSVRPLHKTPHTRTTDTYCSKRQKHSGGLHGQPATNAPLPLRRRRSLLHYFWTSSPFRWRVGANTATYLRNGALIACPRRASVVSHSSSNMAPTLRHGATSGTTSKMTPSLPSLSTRDEFTSTDPGVCTPPLRIMGEVHSKNGKCVE